MAWVLVAGAAGLAGALVLHDARAATPEGLLPNLIADPPDNIELATSSVEGKTRLLLRFNGYLQNDGAGALDIRGTRAQPHVNGMSETELRQEVELYKGHEESLPANIEAELAVPPMRVSQRIFTTNAGEPLAPERYLERSHVEETTPAEMAYSNADGHHHWHLLHVARYSLWNAAKTAEVAPAQKVGFCLTDSEHIERSVGPSSAVYGQDIDFCRHFEPNATSVFEGISPGWRDVYGNNIAYQWVDASDVPPGEYWLREDVDPEHVLSEEGGGPKTAYTTSPVTIPGYDAEAQSDTTDEDRPLALTLGSRSYGASAGPVYEILTPPQHGTLGVLKGDRVTYTPEAGYAGSDSFTFAAREPDSEFPEQPEQATVTLGVDSLKPTIAIEGAQAQMTAGTGTTLTAAVTNDTGEVEWEASAGTIAPQGLDASLYTAPATPPAGGTVTVTARLADDREVAAEQTIAIEAVPTPEPETEPPPPEPLSSLGPPPSSSGTQPGSSSTQPGSSSSGHAGSTGPSGSYTDTGGTKAGSRPVAHVASISRPRAMLVGRELVISTEAATAGLVRLAATLQGRLLGACSAHTVADRTFACRLQLPRRVSARAPIRVSATLHAGGHVLEAVLPSAPIPEMKMRPIGSAINGGTSSPFWCSPSMLTDVLVGG